MSELEQLVQPAIGYLQLGMLEEANEEILLTAVELHPNEPMIHFNLACYAAQTGQLTAARERLAQA